MLDYDHAERTYDNSIFYQSFVAGLSSRIKLSGKARSELTVNADLAMQNLDEEGLSPYKTFDTIGSIAEMLGSFTGRKLSSENYPRKADRKHRNRSYRASLRKQHSRYS